MPDRLLLILLLCASCPVSGQDATELVPASRVRVTGGLEGYLPHLPDGASPVGEPVERDGVLWLRVGEQFLTMPTSGKRLDGTLLAQDGDTLTIKSAKFAEPLRIPRQALSKIEVSRGRGSRGKAALIGMAIGFTVGFVIAAPCGAEGGDSWGFCGPGFGALAGTALALPGGLVGLLVPPGERWERITSEGEKHARLSVVPRRGGAGLALSIGF